MLMSMLQANYLAVGLKLVRFDHEAEAHQTYAAVYTLVTPAASNEPVFKDVQDLPTSTLTTVNQPWDYHPSSARFSIDL